MLRSSHRPARSRPLRGKPGRQHLIDRGEALFDASPARVAGDLGMRQPRVLVDFTEEVLTVDQLQAAAVQSVEAEPQTDEVFFLGVALMYRMRSASIPLAPGPKHLRSPSLAPGPGTTKSISSKLITVE